MTRGMHVLHAAESALLAGMLTVVITFFSREFGADVSRSFAFLFVMTSFFFIVVTRYVTLFAAQAIDRRAPAAERLAIIGEGEDAGRLSSLLASSQPPAVVAGLISSGDEAMDSRTDSLPALGCTARLGEAINQSHLDRIILAVNSLTEAEMMQCASIANRMGVTLNSVVNLPSADVCLEVTKMYGLDLLELRPVRFRTVDDITKRVIDIVLSATLLLVLLPLLLAICFLVKLSSPGPVLYKSRRVGRGGRHFEFLKFRTMYTDKTRESVRNLNEKSGHLFKVRNDPRVTPVGRFLRRWSLDELPQLINVFWGDMSLVGPRPLPASDLDGDGRSRAFSTWAEQRSRMLPGITGLWQIRGRSDLPFERMIELDLEYVLNQSLLLDFRILLETPFLVITGRGAY